jgi:hypothetical protein
VFYTLDVSQYAIGTRANEKENFYHCINKALQKREPELMHQLSGQVYHDNPLINFFAGTVRLQHLSESILL